MGGGAAAVALLPPLQREFLVPAAYEGLSLQEMAQVTPTEVGTVKARLHRARENMKRMLAPMGELVKGVERNGPLSDKELDEMLAAWRVPPAPEELEEKILAGRRRPWWDWLASGTIRVPVPVGLLAMVLFVLLALAAMHRVAKPLATRQVNLSDFRPVKQLAPRIIRSGYETR